MPPVDGYPATARTTPRRHPNRINRNQLTIHAILDATFICNLGFIADGHPAALPLMHIRLDNTVYVHGSPGGHPLLAAQRDGLDVCLTATVIDGLVLARAAFNHSLNYRSVIAHGLACPVEDLALKRRVFSTLIEKVIPGRLADTRPLTEQELSGTTVLGLELTEATAKIRSGGPKDTPQDLTLRHWAGVIPVSQATALPVPAEGLHESIGLPSYLLT